MSNDKQAIHEVVLGYCRGVDRLDLDLVRSTYHSDALDHHSSFTGRINEFLVWVETELAKYRSTMHFVGNHLAQVDGDRAVSETYAMVVHVGQSPQDEANYTSGVRYIDYMERRDGRWAISERWAIRDWIRSEVNNLSLPPRHVAQGAQGQGDRIFEALKLLEGGDSSSALPLNAGLAGQGA
ncbi:nuclear transport factor 2 family protein [Rhodococcus sp. WAY2]|uniref:nuclear transport factor 2 family protein n=1 Tax=Rhodococcus sp. WAY2 TaxID=2663121 RepID=UPI001F3F6E44|nr:nuclear transport factor 2 family protein [Rhodococcus sp. WAY2]